MFWVILVRWGFVVLVVMVDLIKLVFGLLILKDLYWYYIVSVWWFDMVMLVVFSVIYVGFVCWKICFKVC